MVFVHVRTQLRRQPEKQKSLSAKKMQRAIGEFFFRFLIFQPVAAAVGFGTTFKVLLAKVAEAS
jgi:hypothetical protein